MNDLLKHDATRFSEFMVKNYPRVRDWEDPPGWCAWNIAHGFIAAVLDGPEEIVALCAMRPVDRPGFGVLPFHFNERGNCLHADMLIDKTDDSRAIIVLRNFFWFRFGPRKYVTMFRHHEEKLHVYTYNRFWISLNRVKRKKKETRNALTTKGADAAELRPAS